MSTSRRKTKAPSLSFNTADDAANYAMQLVELSNRWFSRESSGLIERYKRRNFYIHTDIFSSSGAHVGQLSLFSVPNGLHVGDMKTPDVSVIKRDTMICHSHFHQGLMDFSIPYFVETPKGSIPSFARIKWFERQEKGSDGFWDFRSLSRKIISSSLGGLPKREFCVFGSWISSQDYCAIENRMIKAGSKAIDTIKKNHRQYRRHIAGEHNLKKCVSIFRVFLSELSVGICFSESLFKNLKLANVRLCSLEQKVGTLK